MDNGTTITVYNTAVMYHDTTRYDDIVPHDI